MIVVNKWDGLDQDVKDRVKSELDRRLDFIDFARVHFISALHGSGVGNLLIRLKKLMLVRRKNDDFPSHPYFTNGNG